MSAVVNGRWMAPALGLLLACSLLLGPLPPAMGLDGVVDHPAKYSACAGAATESAGFGDLVGNFAEDAANCLAHYAITYGTAEGVFSPRDIVPRWQMALFLVRAAVPAGIVVPRASDQGFTDLGSFAPHIQAGINQLAALGIMPGTSSTTYSPSDPVTRQEMALLLARFLSAAPTGPGGTDIDEMRPDDRNFRDLSQASFAAVGAIRRLYEMGVTQGTTASTFSPDGWVTRGQMAVFITRMLAHTNARPKGMTLQATDSLVFRESSVDISITLRDNTYQPFANRSVDIFAAEDPDKAFDDEGSCTLEATPAVGTGECIIDQSDLPTDVSGNVTADVLIGDEDRLTIWVWSGNHDDRFDDDLTTFVTLEFNTRPPVTAIAVTDDLPSSAVKVPFGDSVTFMFQLVDQDGEPVPREGVRFVLDVRESRDGGQQVEHTTLTKRTGADGTAQATFRNTDPSGAAGDIAFLDLDVSHSGGYEIWDDTTIGILKNDGSITDPNLDWSDQVAEPTSLNLSVANEYLVASASGRGAAATVVAALTDQYGGPVASEQVVFSSNDSRGVPNGVRRTTNSRGVASLNYQRDSGDGFIERITGTFGRLTSTVRQYWVTQVPDTADGSGTVRVVDTDEDTVVVVSGEEALLVDYDSQDRFTIGSKAVTYAEFEDDLSVGDTLAYRITRTDSGTVDSFTLTNG